MRLLMRICKNLTIKMKWSKEVFYFYFLKPFSQRHFADAGLITFFIGGFA
jgi:hypothetical protein